MGFKFEKLDIWKDAIALTKRIYALAKNFPSYERYALLSQLCRAAISVALNIAEGSTQRTNKDFAHFLTMALGSLHEVVTALYIARDLGYVGEDDFQPLYADANKLAKRINALISHLQREN